MSLYFSSVAACLHVMFAGVTLVGGILFLAWALKLKPDELKKWVVRLLVVGVVGALLTSSFAFLGFRRMHGDVMMMRDGKMLQMMKDGQMMEGKTMMQNR